LVEDAEDPKIAALWRHGLAGGLWIVRYLIQGEGSRPPLLSVILLDGLILFFHWWANRPLRSSNPIRFGQRDNMTWHLLTPEVIAAFFLVRDILFAVRRVPI
jgi:hypothetical protein